MRRHRRNLDECYYVKEDRKDCVLCDHSKYVETVKKPVVPRVGGEREER